MRKLIIVNNPSDWTFHVKGAEVVSARDYITDSGFFDLRNVRVFNLCRHYRYQSTGYYVSLIAEARGHKAIPSNMTMQDFRSQTITKSISEDIQDLIDQSLKSLKTEKFSLSIYFGRNVNKKYNHLAKQLYGLFQAPLLRAHFIKKDEEWTMQSIHPISVKDIPEGHMESVQESADLYFSKKRYESIKEHSYLYDLAILVDEQETEPPSDKKALEQFELAAEKAGFFVDYIDKEDYSKIGEYDALFIRVTTAVNHYSYRFARRAHTEGLVVIDDPQSILRCTNKVYLSELLNKAKVPTPKTMIVHKDNRNKVLENFQLPVVLKKPDSAFSVGVVKAKDIETLESTLTEMLSGSDLVVVQEYMPTDFDWRIGILDQKPLFACKYHMAAGHWQIYNWTAEKTDQSGNVETVALEDVPGNIVEVALKAANLIGSGLYGVDLKEIDGQAIVIEVNDNPSIDFGYEDALLKEKLYQEVIALFTKRLEKRQEKTR
jgi:glutathione synthase/RimK-type ligase-like ATP-grasp enzyme